MHAHERGASTPREEILRAALAVLRDAAGDADQPIRVTIEQGSSLIRFEARPGELRHLANGDGLPDMQAEILRVLREDGELSGKQIAARTGYAYTGRLRSAIRAMMEHDPPLVRKGLDGYTAADDGDNPRRC